MALLDLLGRRWTLRVIWELRVGPLTFRALRAACDDVSPTMLNRRLADLREAGVVETGSEGYALSEAGRALLAALAPLQTWADDWASSGRPSTGSGRAP